MPELPDTEITQPSVSAVSSANTALHKALSELEVIDQKILDASLKESLQKQIGLDQVLFDKDLMDQVSLGRIVADILGVPYVNLSESAIDPSLIYLLPEDYARRNKVVAFAQTDETVKVAMADFSSQAVLTQFIAQKAGKSVSCFYASERDIEKSLKMYKQDLQKSYDEMLLDQVNILDQATANEAPIEKIVDILTEYAYHNGASDIHLEPEKDTAVVRFRVDGIMQEVLRFTPTIHQQVISRIKFLARLPTDEHLSAQDGKIQMKIEHEDLDIRVSIVPIVHGEKCVLRLLSARYRQFGLADLGMSDADLAKVKKAWSSSFGMILSTGPTGSGKTTSMYAILKILNTPDRNIATIEDPVEYEVAGLNQIQVNKKTNLTFAEGLRSILRQDPNIIYVGEIRDEETADIAINSAMTGHLVVSTLHTNNAATALPRLLDMKIEPFLVASSVKIVIAQRLVRKICQKCKTSQSISIADLEKQFDKKSIQAYFKSKKEIMIYSGKGCPVCKHTGYSGRVGIFEVLELSEKIQALVHEQAEAQRIMQQAIADGMTTMTQDGLFKVQEGITTIEEILRATKE